MSSFLQKLKGEGVDKVQEAAPAAVQNVLQKAAQLDVDVCQTSTSIIIFAPISGADPDSIDIAVEGDNDVVTIQGKKARPEGLVFANGSAAEAKYFAEECMWGEFYRQILLPEKVDPERSEAKYKDGVIALVLPLFHVSDKKTRVRISKVSEPVANTH